MHEKVGSKTVLALVLGRLRLFDPSLSRLRASENDVIVELVLQLLGLNVGYSSLTAMT